MMITVCDQCGERVKAHRYDHDALSDWLVVEANWDADNGNFCSWQCLAEWAMTKAVEHKDRTEDEVHALDGRR